MYRPSDTKSQEALTFCPSLRLGPHPGCPEMPSLTDRIRPSLFLIFDDTKRGGPHPLLPFFFVPRPWQPVYVFCIVVLFVPVSYAGRDENAMEKRNGRISFKKKEMEGEEIEMAEKGMRWRLPTFYTVFLLPFYLPFSVGGR